MFYATHDAENGTIRENSTIVKFKTRAEAEAYLLDPYPASDWDKGSAVIAVGDGWSDCWIKSVTAPGIGAHEIRPFSRNQVYVQRPGQHPGGKKFWITPKASVLVVQSINSVEE